MTQIKVDLNGINILESNLKRASRMCDDSLDIVKSIKTGLDWNISAEDEIGKELQRVERKLAEQNERIKNYKSIINTTKHTFKQKDQKLKRDMTALTYRNQLKGYISGLNHALDDDNVINSLLLSLGLSSGGAFTGIMGKDVIDALKWSGNGKSALGVVGASISDYWEYLKTYESVSGIIDDGKTLTEALGEYFPDFGDLFDNDFVDVIGYCADAEKLMKALDENNKDVYLELSEKYVKKGIKEGIKLVTGESNLLVTEAAYAAWNLSEHVGHYDQFLGPESGNSLGEGLTKYALDIAEGVVVETQFDIAYDILDPVYKLFGKDIDQVYLDTIGEVGFEGVKKGIKEIAGAVSFMTTDAGADLRNYIVNDIESKVKDIFH